MSKLDEKLGRLDLDVRSKLSTLVADEVAAALSADGFTRVQESRAAPSNPSLLKSRLPPKLLRATSLRLRTPLLVYTKLISISLTSSRFAITISSGSRHVAPRRDCRLTAAMPFRWDRSGMTKISNAVQDLQTTRTTNEEQLRAFQSLGNIVRDLMVFLWLPGSAPTPFLQHYLSLILPQAEQAAGAGQAQQMPQRGQSYTPTAARPSINMSTQPIRPGSGQERAPVTYEAAHSASATSSSLPTSRTQPRPSSSGHSAQQSQFMQQQYLPQQRSVSGSQMPQLNGTNEMRASWAAQMRPPAMPSPDSSTYLPNRTQLQSGTGPTPMEFQPPPSGSGHGPSLQSQSPQQQPLRQQQSGSPQLDPSVHALLAQSYQRILQKNRKQGE